MTVEQLISVLQHFEQEAKVLVHGRVKSIVATDLHVIDASVKSVEDSEDGDFVIINF